jgi:hypothetical protein
MINLSFLEQYGPLGNGLKGNMKMEQCSPDFIINGSSRLINNLSIGNNTPKIGEAPSVALVYDNFLDKDVLVYLPTKSICRLGRVSITEYTANFATGETYENSEDNKRVIIPIDNFIAEDPCGTGDDNEIRLYGKNAVVGIVINTHGYSVPIVFSDQNGHKLPFTTQRKTGLITYYVNVYFDTKEINIDEGSYIE